MRRGGSASMIRRLAGQDRLDSVSIYREYQYDWAERICVDAVLAAEQIGATARNYTAVTALRHEDSRWTCRLADVLTAGQPADVMRTDVTADVLVNAAGPWIDIVNARADAPAKRHVAGIKGINVLVKLPDDCTGFGVECFTSDDQHFFAMPWGRHHFFGPTVAPFEGDPDDVRVTDAELDYVMREANHLFPSAGLTRASVVYAWAGVRPRTYHEGLEVRRRSSVVHDLAGDGMPNALALTEGPIMLHRDAGRRLADQVARRIKPSGAPRPLSFGAVLFPDCTNSPPLASHCPEVKVADLRHAVSHEHAAGLTDLLFRRVKLGWDVDSGAAAARAAAHCVADLLEWSEQDVEREIEHYRAFVTEHFVATERE